MRKWLIGLAAVIIVLLLLPLGFGFYADSIVNKLNGMRVPLNDGEFGTLEFEVKDMHRGWFSSSATINMNYIESPLMAAPKNPADKQANPDNAPASKTLLVSDVHLLHGPILWRSHSNEKHPFFGQAWFRAPIDYVKDNLPQRFVEVTGLETGELLGYISLLGEQVFYASTHEISFQDAQGQLNFSGFNLELERSITGKKLAFDIAIPHFNFMLYPTQNSADGTRWLMDGIKLNFQGEVDNPDAFWYGTWFGDAAISVNNAQVQAQNENYALNRLTINSTQTSGKEKDLLDGKAQLQLENIDANQQIMGPVDLGISYTNLDREALADIRKLYETAISAHPDQSFFAALTQAQQEQFFDDLFKLVNRLPSYSVDHFNIGTQNGTMTGDFSVKVTAPATKASDLQLLGYWQQSIDAKMDLDVTQVLGQNITAWGLKHFYQAMNPLFKMPSPPAEGNVTVPEPNANDNIDYQAEANMILNQLQMYGIVNKTEKDYVIGASYEEGLLTINGKAIIDLSNKKQQAEKAAQ